jgi:hypothetical protein
MQIRIHGRKMQGFQQVQNSVSQIYGKIKENNIWEILQQIQRKFILMYKFIPISNKDKYFNRAIMRTNKCLINMKMLNHAYNKIQIKAKFLVLFCSIFHPLNQQHTSLSNLLYFFSVISSVLGGIKN